MHTYSCYSGIKNGNHIAVIHKAIKCTRAGIMNTLCPGHEIHSLAIPSGLWNCPFTKVLRKILMKRIHTSLKSAIMNVLCRLGTKAEDATIEMGFTVQWK